jgi:hypothetical protein
MYQPLGKCHEKLEFGRTRMRMVLSYLCLAFAGLVVFGVTLSAYAACSNPSPMPQGYASPCPVWAVSPASVSQSSSLTLSATPQAGTDYISLLSG